MVNPVSIPVSRRALQDAAHQVYLAGPRAAGVDGRGHQDVFGHGPGSVEFRNTVASLCAHRHDYLFSDCRWVEFREPISKRSRVIGVPTVRDKIVLRAVNNRVLEHMLPKPMHVAGHGMDARASVVLVAQERRQHPLQRALRLDVEKAFPSLDWRRALETGRVDRLPAEVKMALIGVYNHFSPTGIGVPLGLATSPCVLDLALADVDDYLLSFGRPVFRYMDDIIMLMVTSAEMADKILAGVTERLAPFGLSLSPEKSKLYTGTVPWLNHEINHSGVIDIGVLPAERIRALPKKAGGKEQIEQILRHFILGSRGPRFRTLVKEVFGKYYRIGIVDPVTPPNGREIEAENPAGGNIGEEINEGGNNQGGSKREGNQDLGSIGGGNQGDGSVRGKDIRGRGNGTLAVSEQIALGGLAPEASQIENLPGPLPSSGGPGSFRNRRGGNRLVGFVGGHARLLRLADEWLSAVAKRAQQAEARILFRSLKKAQQYGRAHQLWQQARGCLERAGRQLTDAQNEALLSRVWPVLMTAATLTHTEAFKVCVADPLEVILAAIGGKSIRACKAELVGERRAREGGERPGLKSMYAGLMAHPEEEWRPDEALAAVRNRVYQSFRSGRRSNKSRGIAEEARVAVEMGGQRTHGSGAGVVKGDVDTSDSRIEVKSTSGGRWLVPLYQLDQLLRSRKMPVVVLTAGKGTEFTLVRDGWIGCPEMKVVRSRGVGRHQHHLSISRRRYGRLLDGDAVAVAFHLGVRGVWLLSRPRRTVQQPRAQVAGGGNVNG
jgi:hypothetical protein